MVVHYLLLERDQCFISGVTPFDWGGWVYLYWMLPLLTGGGRVHQSILDVTTFDWGWLGTPIYIGCYHF